MLAAPGQRCTTLTLAAPTVQSSGSLQVHAGSAWPAAHALVPLHDHQAGAGGWGRRGCQDLELPQKWQCHVESVGRRAPAQCGWQRDAPCRDAGRSAAFCGCIPAVQCQARLSTMSTGSRSTATAKTLSPSVTGSFTPGLSSLTFQQLEPEDGCCSSSGMAPVSSAAGLPSLLDRLRMQCWWRLAVSCCGH